MTAARLKDGQASKSTESIASETVTTVPIPHNHMRNLTEQLSDVITYMTHEPFCMWCLILGAFCAVGVCGAAIRRAAFGRLRAPEAQRARDKLWNYIFYKFIFVFGVINVQHMEEVVLWCCWFAILGSLHLLNLVSKDRFEYLSMGGANVSVASGGVGGGGRWAVARLAALQVAVMALTVALLWAAVLWGRRTGTNTATFMSAECIVIVLAAMQVAARCVLHICETRHEQFGQLAYYTQISFETVSLCVELAHHVHMLVWSNMFLSMASLVLLMQVRYLFHEIQARLRRHRIYLWVLKHMDRNYPMASAEELEAHQDHCAICWDQMESARKLPCQHLFHNSCLSLWLQQDASCPTCRRELPSWGPSLVVPQPSVLPTLPLPLPLPLGRHAPGHLFHFDGSRYLSWLPSFSVEVTRVRASEIEAWARQAHQLFPNYSVRALAADLRRTHSLHATVDNVLEGRLLPQQPQPPVEPEREPTPPPVPRTLRRQRSTENEASGSGDSRLSKERDERERALRRRKEVMLASARQRYLQRRGRNTDTI
ncbi:E3 ubiquitin-protein ligase AMFR [Eumeta japonica]|uniref:E3 ubiquitin-protein ligase AMFR n=1 Tax=Eumeta variegata TaxID=151549 RepID=A0A4C1V115_EUMVA|nr:E3 ubiquitin-protein ligase AMFR [Eumeta japonica]